MKKFGILVALFAGALTVNGNCGGGGDGEDTSSLLLPLLLGRSSGTGNTGAATISYPGSQSGYSYVAGVTSVSLTPSVSNAGSSPSFSISPALPTGLSLSASTGKISGTASAISTQTSYVVTMQAASGSVTTTFNITTTAPATGSVSFYYTMARNGDYPPNIAVTSSSPTLSPNVTAYVTSYSVSPALPAGLSLNTTTGEISGTPTTVTASNSYTVTANTVSGTKTTTVSVVISHVSFSYPWPNSYYPIGAPMSMSPTNPTAIPASGTTITSFSVSPALPTGLSINPSNGTISGTPTAAGTGPYTVTATNSSAGTTQRFLYFSVSTAANATCQNPIAGCSGSTPWSCNNSGLCFASQTACQNSNATGCYY